MIRRTLPWIVWFVAVYAIALLWRFPVETVARNQIADVEQRTRSTVHWQSARWSLWHSTLYQVAVEDALGRSLVKLNSLDVRPRGTRGAVLHGQAAWGTLDADLSGGDASVKVEGMPLPAALELPFENGRLSATARVQQGSATAEGSFDLNGKARLLQYAGDLTVTGTFELHGGVGKAGVQLTGEHLAGKGSLDVESLPTGGVRVAGPLDVQYNNMPLALRVQGQPGNFTIQPAGSGALTPPAPATPTQGK